MTQTPQTEQVIPFSDRFAPIPPADEAGEKLINSQYAIFCAEKPDFNEQAPISQKQTAMVRLFETGEINDIGQAFESWFGGRKSEDWTNAEFDLLRENLPQTARSELDRIASQRALVKHNRGLVAAQTKL